MSLDPTKHHLESFVRRRLQENGYKSIPVTFEKHEIQIDCGMFVKDKKIIFLKDVIKDFNKFIKTK